MKTSIMLAKAEIYGKPLYLMIDEQNRLSFMADNGNIFPLNESPVSQLVALQVAEHVFDPIPGCIVHWVVNVRNLRLKSIARDKGKDRDNAFKLLIAGAMVREMKRKIKTHDDLKHRVAMEVRFLPALIDDPSENDTAEIIGIVEDVGKLTPRELSQLFPAEKRYDGGNTFKDYFTSAEFLNSLEDKPLGTEGALKFMWDYMNPELNRFNMLLMHAVDNDRKRQGKPSMGEEFARQNGIPLYRKVTNENDSPVLMDEEGNTIPLDKGGEKV